MRVCQVNNISTIHPPSPPEIKRFAPSYLPTLSDVEAEKALSGKLKFQPTPRGVEQGAVNYNTMKTKVNH